MAVLTVPSPPGDAEALALAAWSWARAALALQTIGVGVGQSLHAVTAHWAGSAEAAFTSTAGDARRSLTHAADSHRQAGDAVAAHARVIDAAQLEAQRAAHAMAAAAADYARRGVQVAHALADALTQAMAVGMADPATTGVTTAGAMLTGTAAVPELLLGVTALRLRAWRPGADLAVAIESGTVACPLTVGAVRQLLAAGAGVSGQLLTLPDGPTPLPPAVAEGIRAVELLEDTFAAAVTTAQAQAIAAVDEADRSARRLGARLEQLADGLRSGLAAPAASIRLAEQIAEANVHDPGAHAALVRALAGIAGTVTRQDAEALTAALQAIAGADRVWVVDELVAGGALDALQATVAGVTVPGSRTDLEELCGALLAGASRSAIPALLALFPALEPSVTGVDGWDATQAHEAPTGPAFDGSPSAADVRQGQTGDCYFLAALVGTEEADPGFVGRHLHANGNGTTTITLYDHGRPVPITVTDAAPAGGAEPGTGGASWPQLYEKALAQLRGGYGPIAAGGWAPAGLEPVTGHVLTDRSDPGAVNLQTLVGLLAGHDAVLVSTGLTSGNLTSALDSDLSGQLVEDHVYAVQSVNPDGTVTLRNPWDPADAPTMSWRAIQNQSDEVAWTRGAL